MVFGYMELTIQKTRIDFYNSDQSQNIYSRTANLEPFSIFTSVKLEKENTHKRHLLVGVFVTPLNPPCQGDLVEFFFKR